MCGAGIGMGLRSPHCGPHRLMLRVRDGWGRTVTSGTTSTVCAACARDDEPGSACDMCETFTCKYCWSVLNSCPNCASYNTWFMQHRSRLEGLLNARKEGYSDD